MKTTGVLPESLARSICSSSVGDVVLDMRRLLGVSLVGGRSAPSDSFAHRASRGRPRWQSALGDAYRAMTFAYCRRLFCNPDRRNPLPRLKLNLSISLDGYVAAPNASLENPLGVGGMRLHEWIFGLKSWR